MRFSRTFSSASISNFTSSVISTFDSSEFGDPAIDSAANEPNNVATASKLLTIHVLIFERSEFTAIKSYKSNSTGDLPAFSR